MATWEKGKSGATTILEGIRTTWKVVSQPVVGLRPKTGNRFTGTAGSTERFPMHQCAQTQLMITKNNIILTHNVPLHISNTQSILTIISIIIPHPPDPDWAKHR